MRAKGTVVAGVVLGVAGLGGGVSAQTGFRPASELVAFTPPLYVLPMNVGEVIMGLAERYVYQEGTGTQTRVKVTEDFLSVTVLALPAGGASAQLKGVSEDGRRIVGRVGYFVPGLVRACVWQDGDAPVVVETGSVQTQQPQHVSRDATRWALTTGIGTAVQSYLAGEDVSCLIEPETESEGGLSVFASAVSPDGLTVAGKYNGATGPIFLWSEASGGSFPNALSADSTPAFVADGGTRVVCGDAVVHPYSVNRTYARGWRREIAGFCATALSRDGSMLVGFTAAPNSRAAVWTETLGREDLQGALTARGVDLRGWTLLEVWYISADGRTLVGRGIPPGFGAGVLRWWVATVEPFAAADIGKAGGLGGGDGQMDNNDLIVFIDRYFAADERVDVGRAGAERGGDGEFDNNDFCVFIDLFFSGQP